jgi:hypothetical protein
MQPVTLTPSTFKQTYVAEIRHTNYPKHFQHYTTYIHTTWVQTVFNVTRPLTSNGLIIRVICKPSYKFQEQNKEIIIINCKSERGSVGQTIGRIFFTHSLIMTSFHLNIHKINHCNPRLINNSSINVSCPPPTYLLAITSHSKLFNSIHKETKHITF